MNFPQSHTGLLLGGRYRLLTPLGAGGMAVVWQAHDHVLGRTVAVKMVAPRHAGDARARERIRYEARAAAALSHPNIAQVYDYGETQSEGQIFSYVVMELVPGGTLLKRLSAGRVAPDFAMRVCAEIAAALAAAHAAGLVHRDIKPANVILAPTGAKVVDFGIAAAVATRPEPEVLGTPAYLAPERLAGDAVVPASDVYALGVVLYLLLTGQSPWTAENTRQMLDAHIYIDPAPLTPLPGVPDYVVGLCNRCLAKDPARRPTAQEVAATLAQSAGMRVTTEPSPVEAEPTVLIPTQVVQAGPAPGRGRMKALSATAAVALLVAGAGGWLILDRAQAEPEGTVAADSSALPPVPPPEPTMAARRSPARTQPPAETRRPGSAPTRSRSARPIATGSATTSPATTTASPSSTPSPVQRTFTSAGGSVEATCPAPATAHILSWAATKPYKVNRTDPGPGGTASVTFKRAKTFITMTVTCTGGEPALSLT